MTSSITDNNARSMLAAFEKALNCDKWGQRLEAAEEYQRIYNIFYSSPTNYCNSEADEKRINAIIKRIKERADTLEGTVMTSDVSLGQLKDDCTTLASILESYNEHSNRRHSSIQIATNQNMILPQPRASNPMHDYLTVKIEKIGLKDAPDYVDPFIAVKVKDKKGQDVPNNPCQNTPCSYTVKGQYLHFDVNVHIQSPMQQLPEGFAIFFELCHYKEKKDKVSTRCYAFVEADEIKDGMAVVELYKKPVDYTRKRVILFTEKPLYLHLFYTIQRGSELKKK